jgi:hypothetical protein
MSHSEARVRVQVIPMVFRVSAQSLTASPDAKT